ncbi:MAG: hypothetical protein Q4E57_10080, partial [Eubacteriales bacterium]|nr:hypothetical protein [Eubacteriales bacterium]
MFPFFPRYFWVPPLICGILATGCAAGTAWNAHHHTHFYASGESGQSCTGEQADESQAGTDKRQNSDKSQAK